jgi:hypothetical protein
MTRVLRLQLSIKGLFLLTALTALWVAYECSLAQRQKEAVMRLREMGYTIYYDYQYDGSKTPTECVFLARNLKPSGIAPLRRILGNDFVDRAVIVYVGPDTISAALPYLRQLPHLEEVSIALPSCLSITDEQREDRERQFNQLLRDLPHVKKSWWHLAIVG